MTNKEQFISDKIKKLKSEGYSNAQSFAIANSMYNKMQQGGEQKYAQLGLYNGIPIGNAIKQASTQYGVDPMNMQQIMQNQMMSPQQDFSVGNQERLQNWYTPSTQQSQTLSPGNYNDWDKNNDGIPDLLAPTEENKNKKNTVYNNRVNIMNPYGSVSMDYALNFAGRGFGAKNPYQAGIGTGLSLLKGARSFLSGYGEGKENLRVANEMQDNQFDRQRNYVWSQQGGKVKNSDVIAQNAITDEGQGNINMEMGEFVLRNNGQVQPVVGEPHIKNGKIADGVNATLNNGDKVISDYVKLKPTDIKDLKERYDISLKKGVTFAQAQKKIDQKIGIKKLEDEKATVLEKIEKAKNIKDKTTQELSTNALLKSFATLNEKINTLSGIRTEAADFIFNLQEQHPKKPTDKLYDEGGKVVEESQETEMAQQGGQYITQLAKKHNIPLERAMELMKMQQGGEQNQMPQGQNEVPQQQIMQMIVQMLQQGASPEQVVQTLVEQGVPQEVAVGMTEQVMQGGEEQMPQGNPEQIMQMVAEALQSGAQPEEIMQEMLNSGVPEEQAMQIIQQVASQLQGQSPQEEEMEGQYSDEQEEGMEMAQQGGKMYAQQGVPEYAPIPLPKGVSKLGVTPIPDEVWNAGSEEAAKWFLKNAETFANTDSTYKPKFEALKEKLKDVKSDNERFKILEQAQAERQQIFKNNYPELAEKVGGFYPGTQLGLQDLYDEVKTDKEELKKFEGVLKESGITVVDGRIKEGSYRVNALGDKSALKTYLTDIKNRLPQAYKKYSVRNVTDAKWDRRLENFRVVDFENEAQKEEYAKKYGLEEVGDFWVDPKNPNNIISPRVGGKPATKGEEKPKPQEEYKGIDNPQTQTEYKDRVKNIMPNFEPYIPLFGSIQPIAKQNVAFPRLEPIKATTEPMLAEQERMRATETQRVEQMGMTPQQQEALLAQGLASSQMAANDAISKTEQWNAQNQFATDQYNLGVTGKEQMMNNQYSADYQDKMMATLAALEESTRNQYRTQFLQGQSDKNYITNLNKFNTLSDQFAVTDSGVEYLNNRGLPVQDYSFLNKKLDDMTAEERKMHTMFENMSAAKKRATS